MGSDLAIEHKWRGMCKVRTYGHCTFPHSKLSGKLDHLPRNSFNAFHYSVREHRISSSNPKSQNPTQPTQPLQQLGL